MSNYHLLTDVLYHQDGVVARKKNPVFPLVVVAAGIGLSIWSLNAPALEDSKNLSASLMLVGGVVALLGLIRLVMAFTGGIGALGLPALVLYQAAWAVLTLAMPLLKKY